MSPLRMSSASRSSSDNGRSRPDRSLHSPVPMTAFALVDGSSSLSAGAIVSITEPIYSRRAMSYSSIPFTTDLLLMVKLLNSQHISSFVMPLRRFSKSSFPFRISATVNGLSHLKLTALFFASAERLSRRTHLRMSRYSPTVMRLRPGTSRVLRPSPKTYENGSAVVSGWLAILPMHIEKDPICAGMRMCAPLAVLEPRSKLP